MKTSQSIMPSDAQANAGTTSPAVILFIGDGMGEAHRTAARWSSVGEAGSLNMDTLPFSSWAKTNNASDSVTDSAAASTAIATGNKTYNLRISIGVDGSSLPTIVENAQEMGMSVGLISNVPITHATPAAFAAHVISRHENTEIALQMLEHKLNLMMAGGEDDFLPASEQGCFPGVGHRTDGRNLITEAENAGYTYICSAVELETIDLENTTHLLGLFADDAMSRPYEPTLAHITDAAISMLSQDPDGFFLMVEGGQIDWAAHDNIANLVISDVNDFDAAVAMGIMYADSNPNALLVVTADHETGGMHVSWESSGETGEDGPFFTPTGTPFFVNWDTTQHTSVDVPTSSQGYQAFSLTGTYENTRIYKTMRSVLGWGYFFPLIFK